MFKPQSPCLGCQNRSISCHQSCKAYLSFQDDLLSYKALVKSAKSHDKSLDSLEKQRFIKYMKIHHRFTQRPF